MNTPAKETRKLLAKGFKLVTTYHDKERDKKYMLFHLWILKHIYFVITITGDNAKREQVTSTRDIELLAMSMEASAFYAVAPAIRF